MYTNEPIFIIFFLRMLSLKKQILIVVIILLGYSNTQSQSSQIIGIDQMSSDFTGLVSFDFLTMEHETIALFSLDIHECNMSYTYDHFRKIFYYYTCPITIGGQEPKEFYAINTLEKTNEYLFTVYGNQKLLELEYDYFSNSLLARSNDSIKVFDLTNYEFTKQFAIPECRLSIYAGFPYRHNYMTNNFMYYDSPESGNTSILYCANIEKDSAYIVHTLVNSFVSKLATDIRTGQFFGVSHNTDEVIIIYPEEKLIDTLCLLPEDYLGSFNMQRATYDPNRSLYILPYFSQNSTNKLAIFDVTDGTFYTIDFIPNLDYGVVNYDINPLLRKYGDSLVASVSDSYRWYRNDTLINDLHSRTLVPEEDGSYKFSTDDYTGLEVFSNEILVEVTFGINDSKTGVKQFQIYPNPARETIYIKGAEELIEAEYRICNMMGTLIQSGNISGEINIAGLRDGFYIMSIISKDGISSGKFIKQ